MKKLTRFFEWVLVLVSIVGIILTVLFAFYSTNNTILSRDSGTTNWLILMVVIVFTGILFGATYFNKYGASLFIVVVVGFWLALSWFTQKERFLFWTPLTVSYFLVTLGCAMYNLKKTSSGH